jgi:hypothetical protein
MAIGVRPAAALGTAGRMTTLSCTMALDRLVLTLAALVVLLLAMLIIARILFQL